MNAEHRTPNSEVVEKTVNDVTVERDALRTERDGLRTKADALTSERDAVVKV